jgi:hypothetical protein
MSKTNDTPNPDHGKLNDHGTLADSELDAVTGGGPASTAISQVGKALEAMARKQ